MARAKLNLESFPRERRNNIEPLAYSVHEFAEAVGVSRVTVYSWVKAGDVDVVKARGRSLILREEVKRFLDSLPRIGSSR